MLDLLESRYSPIGLDVGATAIRAVQLRRRLGQWHVHTALELARDTEASPVQDAVPVIDPLSIARAEVSAGPRDAGGDDHGAADPAEDELVPLMRSLAQRGRFVRRDVVLHCRSDRMDIRPVALPRNQQGLPREAIIGALRLHLADSLSIPADQAVFDYFTIEDTPEAREMTVMSTVADREWIARRIDMVGKAGFRCVGVDALPCALGRLNLTAGNPDHSLQSSRCGQQTQARQQEETEEDSCNAGSMRALLDMGYSGSTLVVLREGVPVFSRRFGLGGHEMSALLAKRLGMAAAKADVLKVAYGLKCIDTDQCPAVSVPDPGSVAPSDIPVEQGNEISRMIFDALEVNLNEYLLGLTRSLNYSINEHRGLELTDITLCGGAGHTINLDRYFAEQFGLPTHVVNHPLLNEIVEHLPPTWAQAGAWATALGLALAEEAA